MVWNPLVAKSRRFASQAKTNGRPVPKPTHVVCHVTGSTDLEKVKQQFMSEVSPHYLIDKDGKIYQFVEEENQAWHAGIKKAVHPLYAKSAGQWQKYLWNFDWYKYPQDSVYVDRDLHPVQGKEMATFVARPDGAAWPHYDYFKSRWGEDAGPLNYEVSNAPNAYSVGIEILSFGAKTASSSSYTDAMYVSLLKLVKDICERNAIPRAKGHVAGHEDVNPMQRFGWDPNQGFEWNRIWQ